MKRSIIALAVILSGCSTTVPVTVKFPQIPESLSQTCPDLKTIPEDTDKISIVSDVVVDNYTQYHDCKIKVDGWLEWYDSQRKIFESIK
jgi:PBP1b-binding outer membrane lipoprotein LpoB